MAAHERAFSVFAAAEETGDALAWVRSDGKLLNYAELAERVRAVEPALYSRVGHSQEPVALLGHGEAALLVLYSLMARGRPAVLLHPRWTKTEQEDAVERVRSTTGLPLPCLLQEDLVELVRGNPLAPRSCGALCAAKLESDLAWLFTSGTTCHPKVACLPREAMFASARASALNLRWEPEDRWMLGLPVAHVGGLSILTRCLAARSTVVMPRTEGFDPDELLGWIDQAQITLLSVVPTMLRRLLRAAEGPAPESLRAVLVGGAAAPEDLLHEARERKWPLLATYGMTEACSQITTQRFEDLAAPERLRGSGFPIDGVEVRVTGSDETGAIEIRGASVFRGYLAAESDPFDQDGWFVTGDMGSFDDSGQLHVQGRRSDCIVSGGENVYPLEVERVLLEHPAIEAAVVLGAPDDEWGEQVVAAVVTSERETGEPLQLSGLHSFLEPRLARFKWPRRLFFVAALPLNRNGKVDRTGLRETLLASDHSEQGG